MHSAGQGKWPIVGTNSIYFTAQALSLDAGQVFAEIGTCVVGADVAEELNGMIKIKNDLQTAFGFGEMLPYELRVVGVLEKSSTPDDRASLYRLKLPGCWMVMDMRMRKVTPVQLLVGVPCFMGWKVRILLSNPRLTLINRADI